MLVNSQTDIAFMSSHGKQRPLIATDHLSGFPLVSLCVITGVPLYVSIFHLTSSHATNDDRKKIDTRCPFPFRPVVPLRRGKSR